MLPDLQYAAIRFENFVSEILLPAAFPERAPLDVAVWQTPDRVTPDVAFDQTYSPVKLGWRWGPVWSTAWFRLRGSLPRSMAGKRVALRFSSGTEALLWKDSVPHQGFDPYRDLAFLWERAPAAGGAASAAAGAASNAAPNEVPNAALNAASVELDLLIEAACNLPLGVTPIILARVSFKNVEFR